MKCVSRVTRDITYLPRMFSYARDPNFACSITAETSIQPFHRPVIIRFPRKVSKHD